MAESTSKLGFTDELPDACHVCMIYDTDEERRRIVAEYLAAGVRRGELIRYSSRNPYYATPDEVAGRSA